MEAQLSRLSKLGGNKLRWNKLILLALASIYLHTPKAWCWVQNNNKKLNYFNRFI